MTTPRVDSPNFMYHFLDSESPQTSPERPQTTPKLPHKKPEISTVTEPTEIDTNCHKSSQTNRHKQTQTAKILTKDADHYSNSYSGIILPPYNRATETHSEVRLAGLTAMSGQFKMGDTFIGPTHKRTKNINTKYPKIPIFHDPTNKTSILTWWFSHVYEGDPTPTEEVLPPGPFLLLSVLRHDRRELDYHW